MNNNNHKDFTSKLKACSVLIHDAIEDLMLKDSNRLSDAMRYSSSSVGKRLRPFILIEVADLFGVRRDNSIRAAASIEIVHCYTLIHDDLPAMDNDDYRRGNLSCHKKFDEATAILAGDALLTLAFEVLSDAKTHFDAGIRCSLINCLAQNIGVKGVAGGQMLDLIFERMNPPKDYNEINLMHWMKTARLFAASSAMGAILGGADSEKINKLYRFGELYGLAFQLADDLADLDQKKLIKNNNVLKLISTEQTKEKIKDLLSRANEELSFLNGLETNLRQLSEELIKDLN